MTMIYHLVAHDDWRRAQARGAYSPPSLEIEGFIHASHASQILDVANGHFKGQADLVLLCIDVDRVAAVVREDVVTSAEGHESRFSHIYGPLNTDAVVWVRALPITAAGTFALPGEIL